MNANPNNVIPYEPQRPEPPQTPMAMLSVAVSKGMSPETIKGFMDLQERWEKAQAKKAYDEAFAAFRAEAVSVIKNKVYTDGPLRGQRYAELHAVVDTATPLLSKHGLSASWKITKNDKDWIEVTCILRHIQGHEETCTLGGPPDTGGAKNALQARASSVTFLERYTFKGVTGLAEKGDDADGTTKKGAEPDAAGKKALEACASMAGLQKAWSELSAAQRKTLAAVKEECKQRIESAEREAAK